MAFKLKKPVMFSQEGYKRNSPDVNNKANLIPSGDITMEGVDFPVKGTDNLGNTKVMTPGNNYKFPGDTVLETPFPQRKRKKKKKKPDVRKTTKGKSRNFRTTKEGAGMTAKGVAEYKKKNPGSKLKTAVTGKVKPGSKAAKRRKSFCARSKGWTGERGKAARRRWRC